ncbi:MAG: DivIVA domain-containing protein [Christensenella sp.]|nr:DivIVA domain-containing protein [Christensenella sp.]
MNRKEMKQLLEERFERIALLETRIDTMEQLIEGYHAREQSLIDTLHTAQNTSRKLTEDARAEADAIREKARQEGEKLLDDTMRAAQAAMDQAQQQATELRISAKNESDRMIRDAEIIKSEYEELVDSFNALLEQNANELQETADRFAEFVRGRKIEAPEVKLDGEAFYKSVGALNDARLPDPDGDPATLMKNIYQLQKRPLPTAENLGAEESGERSAAEAAPVEERPLEVPYSEQAWTSLFEQSTSEPQAEFTKSFDPAFTPSDVELQTGECAIPTSQAEHAFDEYFASPEFSGAQAESSADAVPFSRAAYESVSHESASEPQAEFTKSFDPAFMPSNVEVQSSECAIPAGQAEQAFDEYFSTSFEPSGKTAQDEVAPAQAEGPEGAIAEPYSEKAWAQGAFTSSLEPQAEGAAAFDELFGDKPTTSSEPVSYEGVRIEEPYQPMETADESAASTQDVSATEPYSEMAWAQGAFTSNLEPQAEGAAAFDAMFSEPAGSGAFEASFESEQEPREWEPERELDAEDIPTVSRYVSQGNEEEVSLDALLEEIIKAGE